jgi:hypothetical protein
MPNALTGDFDAVLEVSGGTICRLAACMHQNASRDAAAPSIPHLAYFRIGGGPDSGERGTVAAQIGVPRIKLIQGATDRFQVELGLRARFRPDPGSTPLADIICGTVSAEYRFQDIDPNCWGWRDVAQDYLWIRVVEPSVHFDGTLLNESAQISLTALLDEPRVRARINQLLAGLLATRFAARPEPLDPRFRRLRTLSTGDGPTQSAVAIPVSVAGAAPAGDVTSINTLFLDDADFGVAIGSDFIMSKVRPMVSSLVGLQRDQYFAESGGVWGGMSVTYHLRVDDVAVEWLGASSDPSAGMIRVRVSATGWASRLYQSGVFNMMTITLADLRVTVVADQYVTLRWDPAGRFVAAAFGAPAVTVNNNGPLAGYIKPRASEEIGRELTSRLAGRLNDAQEQLNTINAGDASVALIEQLHRIDKAATARIDGARFRDHGVVLRGTIGLGYRHRPQVSVKKTAPEDGFDAIESWIPGGRVDAFEWTWRWHTNPIERPPGPPGSRTDADTFVLRRPQRGNNRFGLPTGRNGRLPGLDGHGKICLTIRGVHVDPVTGALVPVSSAVECVQFGYEFRMPYEFGPYVRVCDPLRIRERGGTEVGTIRVGVPNLPEDGPNVLALFLDERWNQEAADALKAGLDNYRGEDTGLLVVVLFRDGALSRGDDELRSRLEEFARSLPAPVLITEDVRDGWSNTLALRAGTGEPAWRLVSPRGVTRWRHDGAAPDQLLTSTLDRHLTPGKPPSFAQIHSRLTIGAHVGIELQVGPCPPVSFARPGRTGNQLVFVEQGAATAAGVLQRARNQTAPADERPFVVVIVEGADQAGAEALGQQFDLDVPFVGDANGALTRRAGIRLSPTIVSVDADARITKIEAGADFDDRQTPVTGEGH